MSERLLWALALLLAVVLWWNDSWWRKKNWDKIKMLTFEATDYTKRGKPS